MPLDPRAVEPRLLAAVDVAGYGQRTDHRQYDVQQRLSRLLTEAAKRSQFNTQSWDVQLAGDGQLAVLPAEVGLTRAADLIDDYTRALAAGLYRDNEDRNEKGRIRLRVALHYGTVLKGHLGGSGQGPVEVSRVLDAPQLRELLVGEICVVVAVTEWLFNAVVRQGHTEVRPDSFVAIQPRVKEYSGLAFAFAPLRDLPAAVREYSSITVEHLSVVVRELFAELPRAPLQEYVSLVSQCSLAGYDTIADLRGDLAESMAASADYARRNPPAGPPGELHTDVGAARLTLALCNARFSLSAYGFLLKPSD